MNRKYSLGFSLVVSLALSFAAYAQASPDRLVYRTYLPQMQQHRLAIAEIQFNVDQARGTAAPRLIIESDDSADAAIPLEFAVPGLSFEDNANSVVYRTGSSAVTCVTFDRVGTSHVTGRCHFYSRTGYGPSANGAQNMVPAYFEVYLQVQ